MRKKVAVIGQGFVGLAMSVVVANAKDKNGDLLYDVIGIDFNKELVEKINKGYIPIKSVDNKMLKLFKTAIFQKKNYIASTDNNLLADCDIVIIDVNLDVEKNYKDYYKSEINYTNFKKAVETVGENIKTDCLVIIETTVPMGITQKVVEPIIKQKFEERGKLGTPLIVFSYERVMPGKNYIQSITDNYRNYSANSIRAKKLAEFFLKTIINTDKYPLNFLNSITACEMAKIMENSYRAVNIALIFEWTLVAEKIGVNLFEVIDSIKVRKGTHDNMMYPGFGVGGYCIPKDALLGQWSLKKFFKTDIDLEFAIRALEINDKMPLHTYDILEEQIKDITNKKVLLLGISYLPGVDDTRNTPSKVIYDKINELGGECYAHDPIGEDKDKFDEKYILTELPENYEKFDAIIFAVRHPEYLNFNIDSIIANHQDGLVVIDAFDILSDDKIKKLLKANIKVAGVGKGHIKYLKD